MAHSDKLDIVKSVKKMIFFLIKLFQHLLRHAATILYN